MGQLSGNSTKDNIIDSSNLTPETDAAITEESLSSTLKLQMIAINASAVVPGFNSFDKISEKLVETNLLQPEERPKETGSHENSEQFEGSIESPSLKVKATGSLLHETVGCCNQKERVSKHVVKGAGKACRIAHLEANGSTYTLNPSPRVLRSPYSRR